MTIPICSNYSIFILKVFFVCDLTFPNLEIDPIFVGLPHSPAKLTVICPLVIQIRAFQFLLIVITCSKINAVRLRVLPQVSKVSVRYLLRVYVLLISSMHLLSVSYLLNLFLRSFCSCHYSV